MATPGLLKITIFWNKGFGIIISTHGITSKIFPCDILYCRYCNATKVWYSSISMRKIIITSILYGPGLCLSLIIWGMALKFYSSLGKRLKPKVRKCWELITTFPEVTREKLGEMGAFTSPILNRVKGII